VLLGEERLSVAVDRAINQLRGRVVRTSVSSDTRELMALIRRGRRDDQKIHAAT
jgi:hypothetical protein